MNGVLGEPFSGPIIPLDRCQNTIRFCPKATEESRNLRWLCVVCELENLHASEIQVRILNATEVPMPKIGETFIFHFADGTVQLSGRDQVFRKSTLRQEYPARGSPRQIVKCGWES